MKYKQKTNSAAKIQNIFYINKFCLKKVKKYIGIVIIAERKGGRVIIAGRKGGKVMIAAK